MSLRSRLLVVLVVVAVALVTSVTLVVGAQRDYLIDQIDAELSSAGRLAMVGNPTLLPDDIPTPRPTGEPFPEGPISDLFVGVIDESGTLEALSRGQLLDDVPDIDVASLTAEWDTADASASPGSSLAPFTADGVDTDQQFRVRASPLPDGRWAIVAQPLGEVDDTVDRLLLTLSGGALLVVIAMALAMWWVIRLGLRPIALMTRTATAIAEGDRDQRVDVTHGGTETGRLGTAFNDMLDQRDAAEHRLRQFVADASHELRTPLTSIRGYVDLTLDGGFGEHQRDDVMRRIRAESRRMHDLVEDLLLLASLDQGRPLRTDPVDLVAVATDAASDANAMAPQRTIDVDCTHASAVVIGDDMRLRQVVAGLVQNAIDHTPADARITLAVCSTGDAVELSVADDGPGMSAEAAARVFDRFARGDPSRSRPGGGAGLGLAIATSIVHAHGGTLTLDTSEGQGSTFTVRIPITTA